MNSGDSSLEGSRKLELDRQMNARERWKLMEKASGLEIPGSWSVLTARAVAALTVVADKAARSTPPPQS